MTVDTTNSFADFNTDFNNGNGVVLKYVSGKGYPDKGYFAVTKLGTLYNLYDLDFHTFVENQFTDKATLQEDLTQYGVYKVTDNVDYTVSNGAENNSETGFNPFVTTSNSTSTTSTTLGKPTDNSKATTATDESTQKPSEVQPDNTPAPKSAPEEAQK